MSFINIIQQWMERAILPVKKKKKKKKKKENFRFRYVPSNARKPFYIRHAGFSFIGKSISSIEAQFPMIDNY